MLNVVTPGLFVFVINWYLLVVHDWFHLYATHWVMPFTMIFGSFIAGSTPLGGGAVAFPVMTLILNIDASQSRDFSLLIQSVGMTSAGVAMALDGTFPNRKLLGISCFSGTVGILIGLAWLQVDDAFAKTLFSTMVTSYFLCNSPDTANTELASTTPRQEAGLAISSFVGGLIVSIQGNGIDVCIFIFMKLCTEYKTKVIIKLSVVTMAFLSVVGSIVRLTDYPDQLHARIVDYWSLSSWVVSFGAPLGGYAMARMNANYLNRFIGGLILIQYVSAFVIVIYQKLYTIIFSCSVLTLFIAIKLCYMRQEQCEAGIHEGHDGSVEAGIPKGHDGSVEL